LSGVEPWTATIAFALEWRGLVWACSRLADCIATYLVREPPTLDAFRILQRSRIMLILGIVVAWIIGGFLEELTFRAILLRSVESAMSALLPAAVAAGIAGGGAAAGAGVIHLHQGLRAAIIVTAVDAVRLAVCLERARSVGSYPLPRTGRHDRVHQICQQDLEIFAVRRCCIRRWFRTQGNVAVGV
jgi:membrane protease YdiL (CAAX protease family)